MNHLWLFWRVNLTQRSRLWNIRSHRRHYCENPNMKKYIIRLCWCNSSIKVTTLNSLEIASGGSQTLRMHKTKLLPIRTALRSCWGTVSTSARSIVKPWRCSSTPWWSSSSVRGKTWKIGRRSAFLGLKETPNFWIHICRINQRPVTKVFKRTTWR